MKEFNNKTAIVTGGAQGIGKAITREFAKMGMNVVVADNDKEAGEEMLEEFNSLGNVHFIRTDVGDEKSVINMVELTAKEFNGIDYLLNNAGVMDFKPLEELDYNEWKKVIDTNLSGTFLCSKYAAKYLKKSKGSIVNLCSTRAFMSEKNTLAYSASKGGIFALTHSLAITLGPDVRVNAISPGWIDVSEWKKHSKRQKPELSAKDHEQHPAGRVGTPDDVVRMVVFLIHPENSFITGQNFTVDGGMTRKMIYV
jgi:NAD(P)-dependent dehydrogenase (short-subunit alcohol dehydrogenase family)